MDHVGRVKTERSERARIGGFCLFVSWFLLPGWIDRFHGTVQKENCCSCGSLRSRRVVAKNFIFFLEAVLRFARTTAELCPPGEHCPKDSAREITMLETSGRRGE